MNQLLAIGHQAPVSIGFFEYYWCKRSESHPYDLSDFGGGDCVFGALPEFDSRSIVEIESVDHLIWGLYRLFVDGLLWWGNIRSAYRSLRVMGLEEIQELFDGKRIKCSGSQRFLPLESIAVDDRHLISEMACKTISDERRFRDEVKAALSKKNGATTVKDVFKDESYKADLFEEYGDDTSAIEQNADLIISRFRTAREKALLNTRRYLGMVNDLDCYVATSMRSRSDFRATAAMCNSIFDDQRVSALGLHYFDPTLSAAQGHEDKGLIECLMVKSAKVLIYFSGEKDSYGKDAEAAMALSLGKPVLFVCGSEERQRLHADIHPLSRLIEFSTGTPVGAIVCQANEVPDVLVRIFENKQKYSIENADGSGYLRLKDKLTGSTVRLQTNDRMLFETFWNHYHNKV